MTGNPKPKKSRDPLYAAASVAKELTALTLRRAKLARDIGGIDDTIKALTTSTPPDILAMAHRLLGIEPAAPAEDRATGRKS